MVVLAAMGSARMFLMLLVTVPVVLVVLVVLEGFAKAHLHSVTLVACPPIQHRIMALVTMALVEHGELLRRLPPGGS